MDARATTIHRIASISMELVYRTSRYSEVFFPSQSIFAFGIIHSKWQHRKKALKNIDDSQWCPICFMIDKKKLKYALWKIFTIHVLKHVYVRTCRVINIYEHHGTSIFWVIYVRLLNIHWIFGYASDKKKLVKIFPVQHLYYFFITILIRWNQIYSTLSR